ncbi:hypothetical protein ON010_g2654 [Phytophthora cinnamomi]|nr:hypothetical protein ON010_g2654 [Phytophthora cinnamomi]
MSCLWLKRPVPRAWKSADRKKKSELRYIVAFMKLLLEDGFQLNENDDDYKDHVLETGRIAVNNVLPYLRDRGIKLGELDERIITYRHLHAIERIQDPAPADTQNILTVAGLVARDIEGGEDGVQASWRPDTGPRGPGSSTCAGRRCGVREPEVIRFPGEVIDYADPQRDLADLELAVQCAGGHRLRERAGGGGGGVQLAARSTGEGDPASGLIAGGGTTDT